MRWPLGADGLLADPLVATVEAERRRSPAQVLLRYALYSAIRWRSSSHRRRGHRRECAPLRLRAARGSEMRALADLERRERTYWDNSDTP